jgi:hypothetical protein
MNPRRASVATDTALAFAGTLLLFATAATAFEARVTDLAALRVLNGEVPYRDFWTIYAPGSFTALALAFAMCGRELLVSNVMGIVTSAAAVALYYGLARTVCGRTAAWLLTGLTATAFFGTGYHDGFTSYPPALLLILAAVHRAAARCAEPGTAWSIVPGLLLGGAVVFKHDVAGYAVLATVMAILLVRLRARAVPVWAPTLVLGACVTTIVLSAAVVLVALGAGRDLWDSLVVFPLTVFAYVRAEYFPLVPRIQSSWIEMTRELVHWGICNVPLLAVVAGVAALWRRGQHMDDPAWFIVVFAFVAFWFHWAAAHVQINTHAISLAAWGGLIGGAGLLRANADKPWSRRFASVAIAGWGLLFVAEPAYLMARAPAGAMWLGLPGLRGIKVPEPDALWMRELATALTEGGEPEASLLVLSNRNDINVFAESTPYWLTARHPATRHHELHPGVTDTEEVQRQMLAQIARGPLPVIAREHRFSDGLLDSAKERISQHVRIGSLLIDDWVEQHYEPGPRFGPYELMRARRSIVTAVIIERHDAGMPPPATTVTAAPPATRQRGDVPPH